MNKIILITIFLFSCSENEIKTSVSDNEMNFPFSNITLEEAIALKSDKTIFLDFYSDN